MNLEISNNNAVVLNGTTLDTQAIDAEIARAQGLINMMNDYKERDWAIGRNWRTGQTDNIYAWFQERGMTMQTHCYVGGHNNRGAYDANVNMLNEYISILADGRETALENGEISLLAGKFVVNGTEMDMESLLMMILIQRLENLDEQLRHSFGEMQEINEKLAAKNQHLNYLREQREKASDKNKGAWDIKIEETKGEIDNLNSTSQLAMVKLQSLINKRNQAFDMLTNIINKIQNNLNNIVSNMRS